MKGFVWHGPGGVFQAYVAAIDEKVGVSADRFVGGGVSLVFAVLATLVMSAQITRPLHLLAEGAKAIGEGNLDTQIHVGREDELGFWPTNSISWPSNLKNWTN
jgi:methyl-accepting chemotaxis protein